MGHGESVAGDRRENVLRAVRFERPAYVPMIFHINEACWHHYPAGALEELMGSHRLLFPVTSGEGSGRAELDYAAPERPGQPFVDGWGCVWQTHMAGLAGSVTKHPLSGWAAFEGYAAPDPATDCGRGPIDWAQTARQIERLRASGELVVAGLRHGHTFQTLVDLRGYENLILDMADDHPSLPRLIDMVERFNAAIVARYLDLGVEWMCYPDDLGMQSGPLLSPALFRRFIQPVYERLMQPAREAGCVVHVHSDGCIRELADDLIAGGVDVVNLQDLVNGIDWIAERLAGRVCIELDIDRQRVTPWATPHEIDELIRKEVHKLGSREGGLMMIYGLYPGVPLDNVAAVMDAMERYAHLHT